jgi:hypothetical protein
VSFIIQEAAETGIVNLVANGAIANGKPVVVNAAGTVSEVANTTLDNVNMGAFGSNFTASGNLNSSLRLNVGGGRVVASFTTTSGLRAVHGTISGSTITWQTETAIASGTFQNGSLIYDAGTGEWLFFYASTTSVFCVQAIVNGATFTVRAPLTVDSTLSSILGDSVSVAYDSTAARYICAWGGYNGVTQVFKSATITPVGGGTPTKGANYQFYSGAGFRQYSVSAYDVGNNKTLIFTTDQSNIYCVVLTVSGTSISGGTDTTLTAGGANMGVVYDTSASKVVFRWVDSSTISAAIVNVTGNTPSLGPISTGLMASGIGAIFFAQAYDSVAQRFVFSTKSGSNVNFITGKISGGVLSFGASQSVSQNSNFAAPICFDATSGKLVSIVGAGFASNVFLTSVGDSTSISTNLTTENFIGFADGAFGSGQTAKIQIIGAVNDAQSGLTPGQSYYVQNGGTLALTPGGVGTVFAGTAISASEIIVKG